MNKKSILISTLCWVLLLSMVFMSCSDKKDNGSDKDNNEHKVTTSTVTTVDPSVDNEAPKNLYERLEAIAISSQVHEISGLHSGTALVFDKNKNEILYSNEDVEFPIYPASTSKLMTALYALSVADLGYEITVGTELQLVAGDASKAGIRQGETYTLKELVGLMLIPSGNDAAYAIAKGVGALLSRENCSNGEALHAFCDGMNSYAKNELGLDNSNFVTPDGYHDEEHVTTLLDMLKISVASSENATILEFSSMVEYTCSSSAGRQVTVYNTNGLVNPGNQFYNKYITGLKTGHTSVAGRCVCVSYDDGENSYIILVFNVKNEYGDSDSDTYYRNKNVDILLDYFLKLA